MSVVKTENIYLSNTYALKKFTVGLYTGCINRQKSIPAELLYHHQISGLLQEEFPLTDFQLELGSYLCYAYFRKAAIHFIKNKHPDFAFIFLRKFPLMLLNKPFIKYKTRNEKVVWTRHPMLFNRRKFEWDNKFSKYEKEIDFNTKRRHLIELRDFNLLAGLLLGLNRWCIKFLLNDILAISDDINCSCKNLFIVSLMRSPDSLMGSYICKITNDRIRRKLPANLEWIDIFQIPKSSYHTDNIHYNIKGHTQVAQILFSAISKTIALNNNAVSVE